MEPILSKAKKTGTHCPTHGVLGMLLTTQEVLGHQGQAQALRAQGLLLPQALALEREREQEQELQVL